jgi:hypothetical protein
LEVFNFFQTVISSFLRVTLPVSLKDSMQCIFPSLLTWKGSF